MLVAPALTLTDAEGDNISGAKVSIGANFNAAQDSLGIQGSLPVGISSSYNAGTGVLTLSGVASPASYQQALRQVTFSNNSQNPTTAPRTVTFNIGSTLASANGHFYEFVSSGGILWTAAEAAAQASSLYGLQGYLATITSGPENTFIKDKLQGNGWLGANDVAVEGTWRWVSGPESGQLLSYTNWNSGEPNNCCGGEDYLHMIGNAAAGPLGTWNDLPIGGGGGAYFVLGYVVEYGGMPGDPALQLSGDVTVNVVAVNDPPTANAGGPSNVNEGASVTLNGSGSDIDGSIASYAWDLDNNGSFETPGQNVSFAGTDGPSVAMVKLQVCDNGTPGSACTVAATTVNVANVAPSLQITGANNTVYYTNWTSANVAGGTASGVITFPDASTINVSLSTSGGGFYGAQTSGLVPPTINYWAANAAAPYISAQVPNPPPDSDIIQLQGGTSTVYTVTFSQPIVDPIMAIHSLGGGSAITYNFNAPFTILSQGPGHHGGCNTCLAVQPGNVLWGHEGNGTIKFLGTYSTFSWTVPNPETWHGFTFAARSSAALAQDVFVNEGQTATNNGTWDDVPADKPDVTLSASPFGSVTKNADGTWSWSYPTNDNTPPAGVTVTITADDHDGGVTSKSFKLVVANVAPTATFNAPPSVIETELVQLSLTGAADPSSVDIGAGLQYAFDCGSGYGPFTPSNNATCTPSEGPATMTVKGKVRDKDLGFTEYTASVNIVVPTAPAFSLNVNIDGLPATACICTPLVMNTNNTGIEHWWVKANASTLTLTVYAHSVNPTDAETVTARIFPASGVGPALATISASYPGGTAPGTETSGTGSMAATPGTVYLIRVTTPVSTPQQPHYRLKIQGASQAAIKSPTFASIEDETPVSWFFNVNPGDTLQVRLFEQGTPSPLPANEPHQYTVRFWDPSPAPFGAPINVPAAPANYPIDQTLSPGASPATGQWRFVIQSATAHYRLERTGVASDPDVYLTPLTAGDGTLSGTVVNGSGAPYGGPATINVRPLSSLGAGPIIASSAGNTFSFNLPVGKYRVEIVLGAPGAVIGSSFFDVFVLCDETATVQFKANRPPTANANGPYSVPENGGPVPLNGSGSDPDGDTPLTYSWDLDNNGSFETPGEDPNFAAGSVVGPKPVNIQVCDPFGACASASSVVNVTNVNPSIAVTKTANPTSVSEGGVGSQSVTYTFTVTNTSPASTDPVTITGLSDSVLGPLTGSATCQVGTVLAPGASCSFTVTATAPVKNAGQSQGNTFTATAKDDENTPATASASEAITYTNVNPSIAVTKTVNPTTGPEGGSVTYTFTVTNTSPASTDPVTIQSLVDSVLGPLTGSATCQVGTVLAPGASCSFQVTTNLTGTDGPQTHSNTFTATAKDDENTSASASASASVTVTNVAPTVSANGATINENGTATVTVTVSDPGTPDTCTLTIDWGEGAPQSQPVSCNGSVNLTHQYLDDNPTGTPSDAYTVKVNVKDDDGGEGNAQATVTVNNVAPAGVTLSATSPIDENQSTTVTGSFTDPGTQDTHTVVIVWGDGSPNTTLNLAAGVLTFSASHQYKDDGASPGNGTPSDTYTVGVTVTDDDTGSGAANVPVTVNNVAPVITSATATPLVALGNPTVVNGAFTDVGTLDKHTVTIAWGDATTSNATVTEAGGSGTFTASHTYAIAQFYTITVTVADDDTGTATKTIKVVVTATGKMTGGGRVDTGPGPCRDDDDHGDGHDGDDDHDGHNGDGHDRDGGKSKDDGKSKSGDDKSKDDGKSKSGNGKSKDDDKNKGKDDKDKGKPKSCHTTHGFELQIKSDLSIKGELEYNDHRNGDKFHVTSITSLVFIDDPAINPGRPGVRFDTAIVEGVGRLNGVNGVRFRAVITDAGEPGRNDTFSITFPDGQSPGVSGKLSGGNHQAHEGSRRDD